MKAFFRETLIMLLVVVVIFLLWQATVQKSVIRYECMEPTFHEGQQILVNKIAYHFRVGNKIIYRFHEPQRGDVIVFWPPFDSEEPFIKRVIGLPGEAIEIKQGKVYIYKNDKVTELNEPHYIDPPTYPYDGDIIPENEYFVLGDSRNRSNDSHIWGTVPRQNIIGKVWLSIWPPAKWGLAPNYSLEE